MNTYHDRIKTIDNEVDTEHKNALSEYKQRGQLDGKMNQPTSDFDGISPTESAVRAKYTSIYYNFKAEGDRVIKEQESEYLHIGSELNQLVKNPSIIETQSKENENDRLAEIVSENSYHQDNVSNLYKDPDYLSKDTAKQKTEEQFQKKAHEVGRPEPHVQGNWYIVILILLGVSELALNYDAFATLGGRPEGVLFKAFSAGIIFPIAAHFVGKTLRQKSELPTLSLWFGGVAFLISIGLAIGLSQLRIEAMRKMGEFEEMTDIVAASEANSILITFILQVLGIFAIGFLYSYFAHDPSPQFTNVYKTKEGARKEFEKEASRIHKKVQEENVRHQNSLKQIKERFDLEAKRIKNIVPELHRAFKTAELNYQGSCDFLKNIVLKINANYHSTIQSYREQNLKNRASHNGTPKSWNNKLEDLDFNMNQYTQTSWTQ